jgi:hypothetical protein
MNYNKYSRVHSSKICGAQGDTGAGFICIFCFSLPIIPLLFHIYLSPSPEVSCAAALSRQHIITTFVSKLWGFISDLALG